MVKNRRYASYWNSFLFRMKVCAQKIAMTITSGNKNKWKRFPRHVKEGEAMNNNSNPQGFQCCKKIHFSILFILFCNNIVIKCKVG